MQPVLSTKSDGVLAAINGQPPTVFHRKWGLREDVAAAVERQVTDRCPSCTCGPQYSQLSRVHGVDNGFTAGLDAGMVMTAAACCGAGLVFGKLGSLVAGAAVVVLLVHRAAAVPRRRRH